MAVYQSRFGADAGRLLQQRGQTQANRELQRGQAQAQAIYGIGQNISSTLGDLARYQQQAPLYRRYELDAQRAEQLQSDDESKRGYLNNAGGDYPVAITLAEQNGDGHMAAVLNTEHIDNRLNHTRALASEADMMWGNLQQATSVMSAVDSDEQYRMVRPELNRLFGDEYASLLPDIYDEEQIGRLINIGQTSTERINVQRQAMDEVQNSIRTNQNGLQGLARMLSTVHSQDELDRVWAIVSDMPGFTPEVMATFEGRPYSIDLVNDAKALLGANDRTTLFDPDAPPGTYAPGSQNAYIQSWLRENEKDWKSLTTDDHAAIRAGYYAGGRVGYPGTPVGLERQFLTTVARELYGAEAGVGQLSSEEMLDARDRWGDALRKKEAGDPAAFTELFDAQQLYRIVQELRERVSGLDARSDLGTPRAPEERAAIQSQIDDTREFLRVVVPERLWEMFGTLDPDLNFGTDAGTGSSPGPTLGDAVPEAQGSVLSGFSAEELTVFGATREEQEQMIQYAREIAALERIPPTPQNLIAIARNDASDIQWDTQSGSPRTPMSGSWAPW